MVILEENFKWHLEAFASELFVYLSKKKCSLGEHKKLIKKSH